MKFKILTLFPEIFPGPLNTSYWKGLEKKILQLKPSIYVTFLKKNQNQLMTSLWWWCWYGT